VKPGCAADFIHSLFFDLISCWYLSAKKYAELSPSHNITFKSAVGASYIPADGDWESWRNGMVILTSARSFVNDFNRLSQQQ